MEKLKTLKVQVLKTPADFTNLLDLVDLNTQAEVLQYLQNNQRNYMEKFVLSFCKTPKEILKLISEKDQKLIHIAIDDDSTKVPSEYRSVAREDYIKSDWKNLFRINYGFEKFEDQYSTFEDKLIDNMSWFLNDKRLWILDTKNKNLFPIPKILKQHKLVIKDNKLYFKYSLKKRINEQHYYRIVYYNDMELEFRYVFCLLTNTILEYSHSYDIESTKKHEKY